MKRWILRYYKYAAAVAIGALAGFLYWRFVGCSNGSCPITSNPYRTMAYFALVALLFVPSSKKDKLEETSKTEDGH